MIAVRATAEKAMFWAERRLLAQIASAAPSSPGASSAHCSACMPPSEPPMAASGRSTPEVAHQRALDAHQVARR